MGRKYAREGHVSDKELEKAFHNTTHTLEDRDLLMRDLLALMGRSSISYTMGQVLIELGLITPKARTLTAHGGRYIQTQYNEMKYKLEKLTNG